MSCLLTSQIPLHRFSQGNYLFSSKVYFDIENINSTYLHQLYLSLEIKDIINWNHGRALLILAFLTYMVITVAISSQS